MICNRIVPRPFLSSITFSFEFFSCMKLFIQPTSCGIYSDIMKNLTVIWFNWGFLSLSLSHKIWKWYVWKECNLFLAILHMFYCSECHWCHINFRNDANWFLFVEYKQVFLIEINLVYNIHLKTFECSNINLVFCFKCLFYA